ncbi:putative uncharacterized protein CCDC28A-AS1, partial [Plecturocebus cupreus]
MKQFPELSSSALAQVLRCVLTNTEHNRKKSEKHAFQGIDKKGEVFRTKDRVRNTKQDLFLLSLIPTLTPQSIPSAVVFHSQPLLIISTIESRSVVQAGVQCAISAHSNLCLPGPGSSNSPPSASQTPMLTVTAVSAAQCAYLPWDYQSSPLGLLSSWNYRAASSLLPRLECSGAISAHCSLCCLGLSYSPASISQHFGRQRWADYLRSGIQDEPGQPGETLSLLKIQNLAWCSGTQLDKRHSLTTLPRQVLNSWPPVILPSLPPKRQVLTLLPRLECSGVITDHCSLQLLGSSDPSALAPQVVTVTVFSNGDNPMTFIIMFYLLSHSHLDFYRAVPQTPGLKQSSCLSLPSNWDYHTQLIKNNNNNRLFCRDRVSLYWRGKVKHMASNYPLAWPPKGLALPFILYFLLYSVCNQLLNPYYL